MKYYFLFLTFFAILSQTMVGQMNIQDIKMSGEYYCGEGEGYSDEDAYKQALSEIIQQISVSVTTDLSREEVQSREGNSIEYSEKVSNNVHSFSMSTLSNVNKLVLQVEPVFKVFCYISKTEVEESVQKKKNKIKDFVNIGKKCEEKLQIDDAFRNYYWALCLAQTFNENVMVDFNGKEYDCLTVLPAKIKSMINDIKINIIETEPKGEGCVCMAEFYYSDKKVSSLQFSYFDGQSYVGPISARDGVAELDFLYYPQDDKMQISYEYKFANEAKNLDADLRAAFSNKTPIIPANVKIPVKIRRNSLTVKNDLPDMNNMETYVAPQPIFEKKRIDMKEVDESDYIKVISKIEKSIETSNTTLVKDCFTENGFEMFNDLLHKTGKVSLCGKSYYNFINTENYVLARFCRIKIKFKNGKTFTENLVFRFNKFDNKIESIAFALTKKAEDDIFNAAAQWSEVSRFTILNFMEDYQTAYALKRYDYLEQIFSDNAIIITGTEIKKAPKYGQEGKSISLSDDKEIRYSRLTKNEFLERLRLHFNSREYIHLTFEDNITKKINTNGLLPDGAAFGIQINQIYTSPSYSDKGYLTLFLNLQGKYPMIEVRLWQPDKDGMVGLDNFISKFSF